MLEQAEPGARLSSESALVNAAIEGDTLAFADLYDQHMERIYQYLHRWVDNEVDAEDLTQQVFLRAWEGIGRYRHTGTFAAWLLSIAHTCVIAFCRSTKVGIEPDAQFALPDSSADPEEEALVEADRSAVQRAILHLKPEQQQVIVMRYMENFAYSDIAGALGKNQTSVRVIQYRAFAELRRLLAQEVQA